MNRLAIIPARGGSKRIPNKNIKKFCGQPMLSYTVQAASTANIFDTIHVSTDSQDIAKVANKFGFSQNSCDQKISLETIFLLCNV